MQKLLENFLKDINNGKLYRAQNIIAKKLKIARASVSKWCSGKALPSDENIKKMAKIFKKSEKEIQEVFTLNSNTTEDIKTLKSDNILKDKEIKLLKERIKFLEEKNRFLESQLNLQKNN